MTNGPRKEEGLASAGSDEKKYDWQEAENSYKKALASDMTDTRESCITSENRGYALFKLAMQSKKSSESNTSRQVLYRHGSLPNGSRIGFCRDNGARNQG